MREEAVVVGDASVHVRPTRVDANGMLLVGRVVTKMNMYSKVKAHWPDEEGPRILDCFNRNTFDEAAMQICIDQQ